MEISIRAPPQYSPQQLPEAYEEIPRFFDPTGGNYGRDTAAFG
jgi:hypothetical protein